MTTLDVPCPGRATFHRMDVRLLHDSLLAAEARHPSHLPAADAPCWCAEIIGTYLRPIAYLSRGLGT